MNYRQSKRKKQEIIEQFVVIVLFFQCPYLNDCLNLQLKQVLKDSSYFFSSKGLQCSRSFKKYFSKNENTFMYYYAEISIFQLFS